MPESSLSVTTGSPIRHGVTLPELIKLPSIRCPLGHPTQPHHVRLGHLPCLCLPIQDAIGAEHGSGHTTLRCLDCAAEHVQAIRYEPPHIESSRWTSSYNGHVRKHSAVDVYFGLEAIEGLQS
jgi:hypothetical protein